MDLLITHHSCPMKHSCLVCLVLIGGLFACENTTKSLPTTVKGIVVDGKTAAPIAGAVVEFYNTILDKNDLPSITVTETTVTDSEGNFMYTLPSDAISASIYSITADHFVKKRLGYHPFNIVMEEANNFTIPLIHFDAFINLHVKNETEQDKAVYLVVSNPTELAEARTSWGAITMFPLIIGLGEEQVFHYETIGHEYTTFYWGSNSFSPYSAAPFQDSLFFSVGDTLDYTIVF